VSADSAQPKRIDVHNHVIPERVLDLLRRDPVYRVNVEPDHISGGNHIRFYLDPTFVDPAAKLDDLEKREMRAAVISAAPKPLYYYELPAEPAERLCRETNLGMAEFCEFAPERYRWMAHVPMQEPELAARVLEDAADAGSIGVLVGTSIVDRRPHLPEFEPFWDAAERLGQPVLLHPAYVDPHGVYREYFFESVIGNLLETTLTLESLLCAGVLDRHPDLTVIAVHAGGYFPYQLGRLRHCRTNRPELANSPADPAEYIGQIKFDTITHDPEALRFLIERAGAENVLVGSDLPFDVAPPEPMKDLLDVADEETVRIIAEENPAKLFRF